MIFWSDYGQDRKGKAAEMSEYEHWCGTCQIRIYIQRHYGRTLTWQDCPYTCEYATAIRMLNRKEKANETD